MKVRMAKEYDQALGYTFKYLRHQDGSSLRELAERFNVSHTLISHLEKGQTLPSDAILHHYASLMGHSICLDEKIFMRLNQILNQVFEAILFHDFNYLGVLKEELIQSEKSMDEAGLIFLRKLVLFIIESHDYLSVFGCDQHFVKYLEKTVGDLQPFLAFVSELSLAMFDRYHFRLSKTKARLEALQLSYLNPHHKALVKDRLSDLYYHTFDRSKAIKFAFEAHQTYQTFHNTNRAILTDIKMNLYGKRQHQNEEDLPYQGYIEQAQTYKLHEVINDISYVWALRIFRFKKFAKAKTILEQLDLSHPQFYHYYVIVLFGSKDFEALQHFFNTQLLKAPLIEVFKPAIDYVKAYLNKAPDDVLEQHLKTYLNYTIQEELYGESRWAETLLNDFYVERRRYKDVTELKERLIDLILT